MAVSDGALVLVTNKKCNAGSSLAWNLKSAVLAFEVRIALYHLMVGGYSLGRGFR
jgi:hypothetical protein